MLLQFLLAFLFSTSSQRASVPSTSVISDSLTVYIFLLDECTISQFYTPQLNDFYKKYHSKKVGFIGYFPNFASKPEQIEAFASTYHLAFPVKQDYYKDWTRKFGITVTPEVAVWDHREDRLIYRGRVDDSYVRVGKRKLHPQNEDLKNVIDSWLAGSVPQDTIVTQAIGCFINFTDALSTKQ
ncbi:MAG: hypothetical protein IPP15_11625 [Saprospiraceae bacterium]|uniref:Redoxin domain-containing protein n=1 Tax=Candidatus Opimibacter skivensis TaxID=2982028 RepID=A0A9D7XTW1_9BACT|nr:hypothetical protein [Candidatus Opimibacter skivensis]